MELKTYATSVGSVRRYSFPLEKIAGRFGSILDDQGAEHRVGLADDADVDRLLAGSGATSPSEHIHELAMEDMQSHPQLSYKEAVDRVIVKNPKIVRLYANETNGKVRVVSHNEEEQDVAAVIDRKAKLLLDNSKCKTYSEACRKVLAESPALTAKYAAFTSHGAVRRVA